MREARAVIERSQGGASHLAVSTPNNQPCTFWASPKQHKKQTAYQKPEGRRCIYRRKHRKNIRGGVPHKPHFAYSCPHTCLGRIRVAFSPRTFDPTELQDTTVSNPPICVFCSNLHSGKKNTLRDQANSSMKIDEPMESAEPNARSEPNACTGLSTGAIVVPSL